MSATPPSANGGAPGRPPDALPRLEPPAALRRGLGSPPLFGVVQGLIAASIYAALGAVVERAGGWTWVVALAATLFFALLVLSYMEGASLHQERGGVTVLARYGFNELFSFIAGWAILLDYLILLALTAYATTDYAAAFIHPFADGAPQFALAAAVVVGVAVLNWKGVGSKRFERFAYVVLADLALQIIVVLIGLVLIFQPDVLTHPSGIGETPSLEDLLFAFTLAIVAFSGLDASSGLSGDIPISRRGLRRLASVRLASMVPYVGIALVASVVLPARVQGAGGYREAPMLGIADGFDQGWLRDPLRYLIAASALCVLVIACNAAMLGLTRLGYSLALNRQVPSFVGRLHPRYNTPVVLLVAGAVLAIALIIPADLEFLVAIYAFGACLAFLLVHLSVLRLRIREPQRDRPFKMPFNVRLAGGGELPLTATLGAILALLAFVSVLVVHESARYVGLGWMAFGISVYVAYRISEDKPLLRRVSVPAQALTRREVETQFGSMLVPVLGTPLDDDIMQTAGRLAGEENEDAGEGGAVIEALWVFEIPQALPVDAPVPDAQLATARKALKRAKAVGEEYEGVEVATATVRARRAGEAIVREARRRGVEAIVLAAEEPTRQRGGLTLGGRAGLHDNFVGETTRYVIQHASCRVILTAPPAAKMPDPTTPSTNLPLPAPPPGHPRPAP